jgi:hypothetical protein
MPGEAGHCPCCIIHIMSLKRKRKERIPELKNPGDSESEWCSPGSIEQQLDMCESGSLRGDDILHSHGLPDSDYNGDPIELDEFQTGGMENNWQMDLSEEDREGDEMSGDEHSSGIEGGEPEIERQLHIQTGLPGDRTWHEEHQTTSTAEESPHIPTTETTGLPEETIIPFRPRRRKS